ADVCEPAPDAPPGRPRHDAHGGAGRRALPRAPRHATGETALIVPGRSPPGDADGGRTDKGLNCDVHRRSQAMRNSTRVKPISYLKANAAEVLAQIAEVREPLVITQNGEAKAVLQDIVSFEEGQETLALLKILALGNDDVTSGKLKPVADVVADLRAQRSPR